MSQVFQEDGSIVPVTWISCENGKLKAGDKIKISGKSKGKGFQGVVKRWGFGGSPASHGTKHTLRAPGSIGSAFPQKVFKGKKMAGRMGNKRTTIENLKIIKVEQGKIAIKGAVPGKPGTVLEIYES